MAAERPPLRDVGVSLSGCGAFASFRLATRSLPSHGFILPDFERFQSRDYAIQLLLSRMQFLEHPEYARLKRVHMAIINRLRHLQVRTYCAKCFKNDALTGRTAPLWNSANKEVSAPGSQW